MFEAIEGKCGMKIRLTKGDSASISVLPYQNEVIELKDDDYILFTVASASGRKYIVQALTKADCEKDGVLIVRLSPSDTKDMCPFTYRFSLQYMSQKGVECYTYSEGDFELLPVAATVDTLAVCING